MSVLLGLWCALCLWSVVGGRASGQPLYTDFVPDREVRLSPTGELRLDLDRDGVYDVSFFSLVDGPRVYAFPLRWDVSFGVSDVSGDWRALPIQEGVEIGPGLEYARETVTAIGVEIVVGDSHGSGDSVEFGSRNGTVDHYLAFRAAGRDGRSRYGWLRCTGYGIQSGHGGLVIYDLAIEPRPETPIIAGEPAACPPVIESSPSSFQLTQLPTTLQLGMLARGRGLSYQWIRNGVVIPPTATNGAATRRLKLPVSWESDLGTFVCRASSDCGYTDTTPAVIGLRTDCGPFGGVYDGQGPAPLGGVRVDGLAGQVGGETTIEFWLFLRSAESVPLFFVPGSAGGTSAFKGPSSHNYSWVHAGVTLQVSVSSGSRYSVWEHWAFVASRAGDFMRIYRNGVLAAQRSGTPAFVGSDDGVFIGASPTGPPIGGLMDDVRIWNVARTGSEIAASIGTLVPPGAAGLLGWWRFENAGGEWVEDSSVHGRHGTVVGVSRQRDVRPCCAADYNSDGGVDGGDLQAFFTAWSSGRADVNEDGGVDGADVESFFLLWEAGGC